MEITALKEWVNINGDPRKLLACWGLWQQQGLDHLGIRPQLLFQASRKHGSVWLSEEELLLIDRALAGVLKYNPPLFYVLKWRFADHQTYVGLAKSMRCSSKSVGTYLDAAINDFVVNLKIEIEKWETGHKRDKNLFQ